MASGHFGAAVRRLFSAGSVSGMSEGQLLERFASRRDEQAFEALLAQHGPMVLGVCRRWLRDPNDVEDAFQATFLVLVRKAGSIRDRELLGNWLYGVAYRVASRARVVAARRQSRETEGVEALAEGRDSGRLEDRPWLLEEVHRLPETYRAAVVLCYLEGLTHEQAAARLRWPVGTVKGRLSRARELLRRRLARRGLAPTAGALVASLHRDASAAVPAGLVASTVEVATRLVDGKAAAGLVAAPILELTEGVIHTMYLTKLKTLALALTVAGLLATGAGILAAQAPGGNEGGQPSARAAASPGRVAPATITTEGPQPAGAAPGRPADGPQRAPSRSKAQAPAAPVAASPPGVGGAATGGVPGRRGDRPAMLPGGPASMGLGPDGEVGLLRSQLTGIAEMSARILAHDKSPATKGVLERLEQPVAMSFANETPLEDVLKYIKAASAPPGKDSPPLPIYIDLAALSRMNRTMQSPVLLDLEGIPLRTSLRLLLKQLGLAYCVSDGVIFISSVEGVYLELVEVAARYPEPIEPGRQ